MSMSIRFTIAFVILWAAVALFPAQTRSIGLAGQKRLSAICDAAWGVKPLATGTPYSAR